MRRSGRLLLLVTLVLVAGCGAAPEVGERYGAERELWRTDRELRRLAIRPQLVGDREWIALADRFEAIGDRYAVGDVPPESGDPADRAVREARALGAQAWTRAAVLHVEQGDTARAVALQTRIRAEFEGELPLVAADAALDLGRLAEARGDRAAALRQYAFVLETVSPVSGSPGVQGEVMALPLRMARLRAGDFDAPAGAEPYAEAEAYYDAQVREHPGTWNEADARSRRIDMATDLRDWPWVVRELEQLEQLMLSMENPPQTPAEVRFGLADAQRVGLADPEAGVATLENLVVDYPDSPEAGTALLALGQYYGGPGDDPAHAMELLDRLEREHGDNLDLASAARLEKGQIQESSGSWIEALETFRSIPVEFPVSEAALRSHLEIIGHYERVGADDARRDALATAADFYRDALERFPSRRFSVSAREKLARVLVALGQDEAALEQYLALGEELRGRREGVRAMLTAARIAEANLSDAERAAGVYETLGAMYPGSPVAEEAAEQVRRLRGAP